MIFQIKSILRYALCVFVLSTLSTNVFGQMSLDWLDLADSTVEYKFNDEFGFDIPYPIFSEGLIAKDGKEVIISGFALVLHDDEGEEIHILSKYPYSSCFFCGGAGPESVIEIEFAEAPEKGSIAMDSKLKITGTLQLNKNDLDRLNYIVKDARMELVK